MKPWNNQTRSEEISKIAEAALVNQGKRPVIFLDTGAMIDFEKRFIVPSKTGNGQYTGVDFYNELSKKLGGEPFITSRILFEVRKHTHCYRGRRREIGEESLEAIERLHMKTCDALRALVPFRSIDQIRYDVWWASQLAFPLGHKKEMEDRISQTDLDLIACAADTRYSEEVTGVTVLSADAHIDKTIEVLARRSRDFETNYMTLVGRRALNLNVADKEAFLARMFISELNYGMTYSEYAEIRYLNPEEIK